ncbi:uncharacterized protein LOC112557101 isoform X1 [Pomacea canaliculata]|uniref:uncharacterized protein LOC112557101 isoform X1 n=1 Tax=Pomacea canaliculata TaxID=400727 RepID=UPI000D729311|nr:uncharacterized protein LOC112557101 isoform X1 [Pomacea canaliculata]
MEEGSEAYFFYYYKSNQYLSVYADDQGGYTCYSQNLSTNDNSEMFGLQANANGTDRIYSVQGALHFSGPDVSEQYAGQERVRGILCDKWLSCQYWQGLDATATVTWYFSNTTQWTTVSQYAEPVRCVVQGLMWLNQTYSRPFHHIYEFYNFQPDIQGSDNVFEVPANTYCLSGKNTKPVPSLPPAYSFKAEYLDVMQKGIAFVKELYDSKAKVAREDYWDPPRFNSPTAHATPPSSTTITQVCRTPWTY